jgi:hypothetical protein
MPRISTKSWQNVFAPDVHRAISDVLDTTVLSNTTRQRTPLEDLLWRQFFRRDLALCRITGLIQ